MTVDGSRESAGEMLRSGHVLKILEDTHKNC